MGFPSVYYCVILPKPLILVIQLLDSLRHAMFLSLFYLGLAPSVDDYYALPPLSTTATATAPAPAPTTATATASPPPLCPPVTPSAIKSRLRTVRFASSLKIPPPSSSSSSSSSQLGEEPVCAVCLGPLKAKHEVRELGGCDHVFHKGCIDKWVDMGQVTCPLCRAFLLPN